MCPGRPGRVRVALRGVRGAHAGAARERAWAPVRRTHLASRPRPAGRGTRARPRPWPSRRARGLAVGRARCCGAGRDRARRAAQKKKKKKRARQSGGRRARARPGGAGLPPPGHRWRGLWGLGRAAERARRGLRRGEAWVCLPVRKRLPSTGRRATSGARPGPAAAPGGGNAVTAARPYAASAAAALATSGQREAQGVFCAVKSGRGALAVCAREAPCGAIAGDALGAPSLAAQAPYHRPSGCLRYRLPRRAGHPPAGTLIGPAGTLIGKG